MCWHTHSAELGCRCDAGATSGGGGAASWLAEFTTRADGVRDALLSCAPWADVALDNDPAPPSSAVAGSATASAWYQRGVAAVARCVARTEFFSPRTPDRVQGLAPSTGRPIKKTPRATRRRAPKLADSEEA